MADILNPLKIRNGNAARIGVKVRNNKDAFVTQDFICLGGNRAIGGFDN